MNWLDIVILSVIGLSALISLVRGFAKEALSLVIWFGAFYIASEYYAKLAVYFTNIKDDMFRNGAAIAALFVATLIVGAIVNYVIANWSKNRTLRNRQNSRCGVWCTTWSVDCRSRSVLHGCVYRISKHRVVEKLAASA